MQTLQKTLENIAASMPGNFYWKDGCGRYLGCNDLLLKTLGFKERSELVGKTDQDLWPQEAEQFIEKDQKVIKAGESFYFEDKVTLHSGAEMYFTVVKVPLRDENNNIIGVIGNSLDVTKQKKLEEELVKLKEIAEIARNKEEELRSAVTMFAGSIAHDLRTPLATQSMRMEILETKLEKMIEVCRAPNAQPAAIAEQLEKLLAFPQAIKNVTQDMNSYINDTLKALEKTVSGVKTAEDLVNCSLWKCLQKAIKSYPCSEEERQKIHWDRSVDFDFMGNPISFYRVIANLLKNAFEQIQQHRQGEIYIRAEKTEQYNQLIIKDTAGHLTQEIIQQLFKSYKTTKKEGTGIGLAFCKSVMESFGGDITCYLVDGDKIEFCLSFPNKG